MNCESCITLWVVHLIDILLLSVQSSTLELQRLLVSLALFTKQSWCYGKVDKTTLNFTRKVSKSVVKCCSVEFPWSAVYLSKHFFILFFFRLFGPFFSEKNLRNKKINWCGLTDWNKKYKNKWGKLQNMWMHSQFRFLPHGSWPEAFLLGKMSQCNSHLLRILVWFKCDIPVVVMGKLTACPFWTIFPRK